MYCIEKLLHCRFFEMQVSFHEETKLSKINSTGFFQLDYKISTVSVILVVHAKHSQPQKCAQLVE